MAWATEDLAQPATRHRRASLSRTNSIGGAHEIHETHEINTFRAQKHRVSIPPSGEGVRKSNSLRNCLVFVCFVCFVGSSSASLRLRSRSSSQRSRRGNRDHGGDTEDTEGTQRTRSTTTLRLCGLCDKRFARRKTLCAKIFRDAYVGKRDSPRLSFICHRSDVHRSPRGIGLGMRNFSA